MRKLDTTTPIAVMMNGNLYCFSCCGLGSGEPQTEQQVVSFALHPGDEILCQQGECVLAEAPIPTDEDYAYRDKAVKLVQDALTLLTFRYTHHEEKRRIERVLYKMMKETIELTGGSKEPWTKRAE